MYEFITYTGLFLTGSLIIIGAISNMKKIINKVLAIFDLELVKKSKLNQVKKVINQDPSLIKEIKESYKKAA